MKITDKMLKKYLNDIYGYSGLSTQDIIDDLIELKIKYEREVFEEAYLEWLEEY